MAQLLVGLVVLNLLVVFACASLYFALDAWSPQGWWVLPYGGVLYAIGVGILRTAGGMKQRAAV